MANVKISQLPSATTPLGGTEVLPIVQGTTTKKVTVNELRATAVTAVTGTAPVVSSGGTTPAISMAAANGSTNGYLTSTDWTTFNSKYSVGGALGTPSSGTATNLTGLPLTTGVTGILPVANGGNGTATPSLVAGSNVTITGTWPNQTIASTGSGGVSSFSAGTTGLTPATATTGAVTLAGTLAVANGGTGTATPSLVAGTNVTITGTWPNQTINSSGGGGSMVYPGAGIPLSTGSAWGTSYSTTGTGDVVLSTSPTLVTPLLGTPTSGDFSSGTFTWPTFNQNTTGTAAGLSATLAVASGGTGQTTAAAAITALTGTQTAGQYLRSDGTNAALAAIQAADVPTLNQNTTGTAAGLSATLAVASGGTGLTSVGTAGNVLTSNGTIWTSSAPSGGGLTYIFTTTPVTATSNQGVLADTSGGSFTVTLPATPATGAQVVIADAGNSWGTNNLTVGRNGSTIGGLAEDLVCDINGVSVQFVYDGTTWETYAQIGGNGGTAVTLDGTQTLTNKTLTSPVITQNIQVISTDTTAVRSSTYVFTATLTLTLPASPTAGDMVMFSNNSGTATPVIARNGSNIEGLAEDMTVDNVNYFGTLVYADATRGWIFQ